MHQWVKLAPIIAKVLSQCSWFIQLALIHFILHAARGIGLYIFIHAIITSD